MQDLAGDNSVLAREARHREKHTRQVSEIIDAPVRLRLRNFSKRGTHLSHWGAHPPIVPDIQDVCQGNPVSSTGPYSERIMSPSIYAAGPSSNCIPCSAS